jgi:hypothetical protein
VKAAASGGPPAGATAVTLDAVADLGVDVNATTWADFTHVLAADANYVVACVLTEQNAAPTVTFGGVAMTTDAGLAISSNGSSQWVHFFYLLAANLPAAGSKAVTVASGNATAFSGLARTWSFKGAKQQALNSGSNRQHSHASASAASSVVTLAAVPAGCAVVSGGESNATNIDSTGSDLAVGNNVPAGGGGHSAEAGHTIVGASPVDVTHTYTPGSTTRVASMMLEIRPELP